MPQRRINVPFVRSALVVLAIILCAGLLLNIRSRWGKGAKYYEEQGDVLAKTGPDGALRAVQIYQQAVQAAPGDVRLRMKFADYLRDIALTADGQEQLLDMAMKQWDLVLQTEPSNKDALERTLDIDRDRVENFHGITSYFADLQNVSSRILKLDENDSRYGAKGRQEVIDLKRRAKGYYHISVISAWLVGIATPPSMVADSLKELKKLLDEDLATNDPARVTPDVVYYLCEGYVKQAHESRAAGDIHAATAKEKQAYETFSSAFAKAPDNPTLAIDYYYVLRSLTTGVEDDDARSDRVEYAKRVGEVLAKARADAKARPDDPSFLSIYQQYIFYLARKNRVKSDLAAAGAASTPMEELTIDALLKEMLSLRPDDQQVRLFYADRVKYDSKLRVKAIVLLEQPVGKAGESSTTIASGVSKRELQADTERELVDLLLEEYASTTDPAQRPALQKQIDDHYSKLVELNPTNYLTFYTKGLIALVTQPTREGAIEAIPLFERSREILRQSSREGARNPQLDVRLAQAYTIAQQAGLARTQWRQVVETQPDNIVAHKALAQLLIEGHQVTEAHAELQKIRYLEKDDAKKDLELQRMEEVLVLTNPSSMDPQAVEKSLAALPETTSEEIRSKIQFMALARNHEDDIVRLNEILRQRNPADIDANRTLVQIYDSQGKKDLAAKVVKEGLAHKPDSIELEILDAQLKKDMPRVMELTKKAIAAISDPARREISYFEFYRGSDDRAEALKHLQAAEKVAPDSQMVLDMVFADDLQNANFADAERVEAKLADQNADQAHGLIYKFRVAEARRDLKSAEEVASELVDSYPAFATSWVNYGDVLRQKGKLEDAVAKYNMGLERQPGNMEALRGLAQCYLFMNPPHTDDAKSIIDQALKLHPHDPWFTERLIAWYLDNDPQKAIEPREEEAKASPDKIGPQIALYAAWWEVAKQQLQKGKMDDAKAPTQKARDGFAQILAKWPGENELEYAYFADICAQLGDYPAGEKALQQMVAIPKWKDSYRPTLMLAQYYTREGKTSDAEAAWNSALTMSKNAPEVRRQVAEYYLNARKYQEALKVVDVNDKSMQQLIIEILVAAGQVTEAQQHLDQLLKDAPNDSRLMAIKGMLLLQADKPAQAMVTLNAAVALDPKNAAAYFDRGLAHMRGGRAELEDAIRDFKTARDLADNGNPALQVQSRLSLGEAMRAHGQSEEAITELSTALRLQPANKELRMRLIEMLGTLLSPRWTDVEKYIHEAQSMPEFRGDPDWWRVEAQMWAQRKDDEKSLTAIRQALRLSAGQPARIIPLMQDYLMVLIKLKQFPQLASESAELLKNPDLAKNAWWVYQARGIAEARQNQKQEALVDFDHALQITSTARNDDGTMMIVQSISDAIGLNQAIDRLETQAAKGDNHWRIIVVDLYLNKQEYARAEAKVEGLLADMDKLQPSEKEATYVVAGLTYMLSGKYDQARTMYEKLLALNPEDTVALNNLACIWVDDVSPPDTTKALSYSSKAMDIMQKSGEIDANVLETQGWILVRSDRLEEGINDIQTALARRPIMEGYYHLGVALLQKKLAVEAQLQLQKAQRMLDDRRDKGQPIDGRLQVGISDALAKAKSMAAAPNASPGTRPTSKP